MKLSYYWDEKHIGCLRDILEDPGADIGDEEKVEAGGKTFQNKSR